MATLTWTLLMLAIIVFNVISVLILALGINFILGLDKISASIFSILITASVSLIVFAASLFDVPTLIISFTTIPPAMSLSYVSLSSSLGIPPNVKRILGLALISEAAMMAVFAFAPLISYSGRVEVEIPGTIVRIEMPGIYSLAFISFSITASVVSLMSMVLKKDWEKRWALMLPSFMTTIFSLTNPQVWVEAATYASQNLLVSIVIWAFCVYIILMAYIQLT